MARLYADEDFDFGVVEELRRLGHDVVTAQEAGQANQAIPDHAVLAFGSGLGRALLTFNRRHFRRLHPAAQPHRGIVICTRDSSAAALAARVHEALVACPALDGQLIRIYRPPTP
jgi:hypothetical protein